MRAELVCGQAESQPGTRRFRSSLSFGLLLASLLCFVLELGLLAGYLSGLQGSTLLGQATRFGGLGDVIPALLLLIHATSS